MDRDLGNQREFSHTCRAPRGVSSSSIHSLNYSGLYSVHPLSNNPTRQIYVASSSHAESVFRKNIFNTGITCNCQLVPSADNLCKQFETRSGPTKCRAWSGSKLFDTLMVFLKEFFKKHTVSIRLGVNYFGKVINYLQLHWKLFKDHWRFGPYTPIFLIPRTLLLTF